MKRVLAIGLDGWEESLGRELIEAGELPHLARLQAHAAHYLLDHGPAQRTGLAWEHVASGLSPQAANRWAAVHFDTARYTAWQEGTQLTPFTAQLKARSVVFDAPYFDLRREHRVRGVVNWGAHDPGVPTGARPEELLGEFEARFGAYPARDFIYGFVWPSAARTAEMGAALVHAVDVRAAGARWLLTERLPDWDLGIVVVSEPHSAIEALWHGVDAMHPLHGLPSAEPAREGLHGVYRAVDRLVGELQQAIPDATLVVFSMGGMGPNRSDVASMLLLPELMYRRAFGRPLMQQPSAWTAAPDGFPVVGANAIWAEEIVRHIPRQPAALPRRVAARVLPAGAKRALRKLISARERSEPDGALRLPLDWMPAIEYQPYWQHMDAFALPSFYDGRIRINLVGRERAGRVALQDYARVRDEIEKLLRECRDARTGEGVVDFIERPEIDDPLALGPTGSDLVVVWKGISAAISHPQLGTAGPVPLRRTGGHTGPYGVAWLSDEDGTARPQGVRSAFDVVPTIVSLLGERVPEGISGSVLPA